MFDFTFGVCKFNFQNVKLIFTCLNVSDFNLKLDFETLVLYWFLVSNLILRIVLNLILNYFYVNVFDGDFKKLHLLLTFIGCEFPFEKQTTAHS